VAPGTDAVAPGTDALPPGTDALPPGTDAAAPPTCADQYALVAAYIPCFETATECGFNANTGGGDCATLCLAFGGICLGAFDNPNCPGMECMMNIGAGDDCFTDRGTELCVCSHP
jgi:hypothetical protein